MKFKNRWYNDTVRHEEVCKSNKKEDILDYLYRTKIVPYYCTYLLQMKETEYECEEYMQEIWLQICNLSEKKLQDLYFQGKTALTAYIAVLIRQNCKSQTSPAYCRVRKENKKYIHVNDREWELYDEYGEFPDYLKNGALRSIQEYDKDNNLDDFGGSCII